MRTFHLILSAAIAGSAPVRAEQRIEQNLPPVIKHFPTVVGYRGQPIPVYANVTDDADKLKRVSLYYALSQQKAPVNVPMKKVRGDRYSGLIPANFFGESTKIWYFIEARDAFDDKSETTWFPVTIKDPDVDRTQNEDKVVDAAANKASGQGAAGAAGPAGKAFPADAIPTVSTAAGGGIGAGTVVGGVLIAGAVGGGIALAGGGGGGGGDDDGGGGGFDPSSTVIVNANGSASGGFAAGPQDRNIDGSGAVGGRPITGIRATVNYDAYSIADRFQIVYEGDVIADSGVVSGGGAIQGTAGGSSPIVTIRVLTPSSDTAWDWSARVEYSVAD